MGEHLFVIDEAALTAERPHLVSVAYRMLGSAAEAEDAVQEALTRALTSAPDDLRSPRAFLTTVVSRICLDRLKSARARRELYVGPWLPEPVRTDVDGPATAREPSDPHALSLAFLVLLETLSPTERAVFLLHEVFDYSHEEIAEMLSRTPAAVRQSLHRAREHVRDGRPRFAPTSEAHSQMLYAFMAACTSGDVAQIESLLANDAELRSDGGGKVKAARKPIRGANHIARFFVGILRKSPPVDVTMVVREINGLPTLVLSTRGVITNVLSIETDGARVYNIHSIVNPDKLGHV